MALNFLAYDGTNLKQSIKRKEVSQKKTARSKKTIQMSAYVYHFNGLGSPQKEYISIRDSMDYKREI